MKKNNKNFFKKSILLTAIPIVIISTFSIVKSYSNNKKEKELIKKNYVLLQKLENRNMTDVEKKISDKENEKDQIKLYEEENKKQSNNKNNGENNKLFFESSVFMGDSITEALDFYNILNSSSVLAKKGQNVISARKYVPQLQNLNPKKIFILYGENDLELFSNVKDFEDNYTKLVKNIKNSLPNSQIYLQSVMPVQPKAQKNNKNLSNARINQFLECVKKVAEKEKVKFIDIRPVISGKDYLYEPDGMHFSAKFYDLWLDFLKQKL